MRRTNEFKNRSNNPSQQSNTNVSVSTVLFESSFKSNTLAHIPGILSILTIDVTTRALYHDAEPLI